MNFLLFITAIFLFSSGVAGFILTLLGYRFELNRKSLHGDVNISSVMIILSAAMFVTIFLVTGLVSLSLAAGAAVFLTQSLFSKQKVRKVKEERVEAVAIFAQSLSDSIGGGKSVSVAMKTAAVSPPKPIHVEVKRLQINLSTGTFEDAVEQFVRDVDDPAGDLLGAHLLQANEYATANLAETMRTIAETLNEYIITSKKVATGRRQQEFEIKGLSVLLVVMIVGLFLMAPDLLDVYKRDIGGEFKLVIVFGCAVAGWILTDRLTESLNKSDFVLKQRSQ